MSCTKRISKTGYLECNYTYIYILKINDVQEIRLRATQYLPDIIQLQQFFAKLYNVNVDDEQVNKLTVMDLHQGTYVHT